MATKTRIQVQRIGTHLPSAEARPRRLRQRARLARHCSPQPHTRMPAAAAANLINKNKLANYHSLSRSLARSTMQVHAHYNQD